MQLDNFSKAADRPIEGVIKADDDVSLYVELDEYVITKEVAKRFDNFLDAHLNYGTTGCGCQVLCQQVASSRCWLLENRPIEKLTIPSSFSFRSRL